MIHLMLFPVKQSLKEEFEMKIRSFMRTGLAAAVCAVFLGGAAGAAENAASVGESLTGRDYDRLVVAGTTALTGAFFTDMWGNAAADLDVRSLIHGYDLIRWNAQDGIFETDPSVVSGIRATQDAAGNRTFRISLYTDLRYSSGEEITAADYAFSILLAASPEVEEIGGRTGKASFVLGYDDFRSGRSRTLPGVRVLGNHELAVTIRSDYLPYFYELGFLNFTPAPVSVIAPGLSVHDDGNGAYIAGPDGSGGLTAELLAQTILDEQTGYLAHPSVVSGPYLLKDFDGDSARFEINPMFKGDANGNKPSIAHLVYKCLDNTAMIDELSGGEADLLNRVSALETAQKGMALVQAGEDFAMSNYPRSGMSFLSFCAERPAVAGSAVRQAVAYCLDKEAVTKGYEGTLGVPMNLYSGLGQWMYQAKPEDYEASLDGISTYGADAAMDENVAEAARLLEEDGWTLNEAGEPFDPSSDSVRCRQGAEGLEKLSLTVACPKGSRICELLADHLGIYMEQAGMQLTVREEDMRTLLAMYYNQVPRECDMLFLATNFDVVFDPAESFTQEEGHMCWKDTRIPADRLCELAEDMRRTKPGDLKNYYQKWVAFQEEFTRLLPVIPVYSNVYFDFYTSALQDYEPSQSVSWAQAIVGASLSDG